MFQSQADTSVCVCVCVCDSLQCEAVDATDSQLIVDVGIGERRHVHVEELSLCHGFSGRLAQRAAHLCVLVLPLIPAHTHTHTLLLQCRNRSS